MNKIYYSNLLGNQNQTAKDNIVWVSDITEIELNENKKFYIYLCIDIHTNKIIAHTTSERVIKSQAIVKCLTKTINERFHNIPKIKTILHTDRGSQFSSQTYKKFLDQFQQFIEPSMSRENTPTDNPVAERMIRTFKGHCVNGLKIQEAIQNALILNFNNKRKGTIFRSIVNNYVKIINNKPNKKSLKKGPEKHDKDVSTAAIFMTDPKYPKAFSEHFGDDIRRLEIDRYKTENKKVIDLLQEFAAKKAEVVDETPFDYFLENKVVIEVIDKQINKLYQLIEKNQQIIKESVEKGIKPVNENIQDLNDTLIEEMEVINKKLDKLLPKVKKDRQIQPLRDPINFDLFPLFLINAGNYAQKLQDLRKSQLRIAYTILYHTGLRINEIRQLTEKDLKTAINAAQFNIIHYKTKKAYIHVLSKKGIEDLQNCESDMFIIFEKYKYKYLFGKNKPLNRDYFIDMVNKDLEVTCKKFNIPFNIKSHSFRINMITNLLKITSVQNTADIIGHSDIRATMQYKRYALSKKEIQDLLNEIDQKDGNYLN